MYTIFSPYLLVKKNKFGTPNRRIPETMEHELCVGNSKLRWRVEIKKEKTMRKPSTALK